MRYRRIFAALFVCLVGAVVPAAARPHVHSALLVQPARADFDRDGKPDVATVEPDAGQSVVRITSSRSGVREIVQPNTVLAVAGFDFDHDGDIDLLVGTSEGPIVWVNDGLGLFLGQPVHLASIPDEAAKITSVVLSAGASLNRDDSAGIGHAPIHAASTPVDAVLAIYNCPALHRIVFATSPRAPPIALS